MQEGVQFELPPMLVAAFQTGSAANGGLESATRILEGLKPRRFWVVTQMETGFTARWRCLGATIIRLDVLRPAGRAYKERASVGQRLAQIWCMLRSNLQVARLVSRERIQLVHCNDHAAFWHVGLGGVLGGAKVLMSIRDTKGANEKSNRMRWILAVLLCTKVVVLSHEMERFWRNFTCSDRLSWFNRGKFVVVYSIASIPDEAGQTLPTVKARAARRIEPEEFAVGFIATFNDKKNQLEFIRQAGPLLKARCPGVRVHFLGDFNAATDAYARLCGDEIARLGLGEILLCHGFTADIAPWYRALDLVLVPTRNEGLARCMIESLAWGTPVLSFDVCSAREILEQFRCGLVVPQGDYPGLVDAIRRLQMEPQLHQSLKVAGPPMSRVLFAEKTVTSAVRAIYCGVVTSSNSPIADQAPSA